MRSAIGRGLIDIIFSITIILVLYGVFAGYWLINLEEAKKVTLENQLTNLRYAVELYKILEGRYPNDLRILAESHITLRGYSLKGRRYLEFQPQDREGYPVDPYGKRFIYDNNTGAVKGRRK